MRKSTTTGAHSSSRREFLRAGLTGLGTLSLPGLLRLRAASAVEPPRRPTAVILVWLRGGCSHLDTYDPKPDVSSDYRGSFATIYRHLGIDYDRVTIPDHAGRPTPIVTDGRAISELLAAS